MKKIILIFCTVLTILSLTSFGFINWSNTDTDQKETSTIKAAFSDLDPINANNKDNDLVLFYNVDSRFIANITKENLDKAISIIDILPEKATKKIVSYQAVKVSILDDDSEISESREGEGDLLNFDQIKLLASTNYSTDIFIRADYKIKNPYYGNLEDRYLTYFITIIPEKEAVFTSGHDALIKYLMENSKEETAIITGDNLQPGKVSFTITKEGTITNAKLTSTSGYSSVDKVLVELINNMSKKWEPATNAKGEKVDQKLVFFFGLEGC